ncbi:MAG: gamma-glutamyltransferase family protein [Deltaproteobacteria bacterium]|jgi:gamma-glutamyltranspeptidase/glutathione hydrolase|nr:gamma-glutamyltransferase family protein [Deltaproteobacteria bacterium]
MLKTVNAYRGMVTSPHHLASQAGLAVLREGGNAVEAAIATTAALCVVYPHMTGLGGDAFWTIYDPASGRVQCIDASGLSGENVRLAEVKKKADAADFAFFGPQTMLTCPGAVGGWARALEMAAAWSKPLPLSLLLEDAIYHAEHGYPVSAGQAALIASDLERFKNEPGFAGQFLTGGLPPAVNSRQTLPALARTMRRLIQEGLDGFYRGKLARDIAAELQKAGSSLTLEDLRAQRAVMQTPLHTTVRGARLYNCPPPSQGVSSLMILGLYDALVKERGLEPGNGGDKFELLHALVECTKLALIWRNAHLADREHMLESAQNWLEPSILARVSADVDLKQARPWGAGPGDGDTIWFGVIDAAGRAVSCIQSIYFGFGSGVVLPDTGITWHNRGLGFTHEAGHPNCIGPRKRPFHTLNPALAVFDDGRVMPYGSMGGEGQPQTQAWVFSRYAWLGEDLQNCISEPRWVLGRTWGKDSATLKLEADFDPAVVEKIRQAGHNVEIIPAKSDVMGHAGALVRDREGLIQGATDPRSDGLAAGW